MQITPNQPSITTPVRPASVFSRSSSTTGYPAVVNSARPSLHLHSSLLHTPSGRPHRISVGTSLLGEMVTSPLLPSFDSHPLPPSSGRFERLQSGRGGWGSRSEEDAFPFVDVDQIMAEARIAANSMSREALESAITKLYSENLMLQSTVLREREDLVKLQEGMRETYEAAEKEGESITNQLTRRVDAVRRQKAQLEAQLHKEETMKAEQEQKLVNLKVNNSNLARRLQREEDETLTEMNNQLQQIQKYRQHLEGLLLEQSSSLHQLQELFDVLQTSSEASSAASHSVQHPCLGDDANPTSSSVSSSQVAGLASSHFMTSEYVDPASDPREMLQYLKHEVEVVEGLQQEAFERGELYRLKREELERRINQAERERCNNRHSLEDVRQELEETAITVTELASAAEIAMEEQIDRHIHASSHSLGQKRQP